MKFWTASTAAFLLAGASAAHANDVTFGSSPGAFSDFLGDGTVYSEAGMTFTSQAGGELKTWQNSSPYNAAGNSALFQNARDNTMTATLTGGGAFFLNSIDLADVYNAGSPSLLIFAWTTTTNSFSQALQLDTLRGFQTFNLNLAGVTSFTLTQTSPYYQLDNVRFNIATPGVPEPATWALMMLGFGGIGLVVRRKQKVLTRVCFA